MGGAHEKGRGLRHTPQAQGGPAQSVATVPRDSEPQDTPGSAVLPGFVVQPPCLTQAEMQSEWESRAQAGERGGSIRCASRS